jgi:predicted PurR-regulated permease PerM
METLLIVAIVVTALSVLVQAAALLGMYLLSRQTTAKVNNLVDESHKLMEPLESAATNFKSASNHVHGFVTQTSDTIRSEVEQLRDRVNETASELQSSVLSPVREWSAIAKGVTTGFMTLFRRRTVRVPVERTERGEPAA